jgi:hypothetical protein
MIRNLTVTAAAANYNLTAAATFKAECAITGSADDAVIATLIQQASGDIAAYLGRVLARETVVETFRLGDDDCEDYWRGYGQGWARYKPGRGGAEPLALDRWPVASMTSVVEDGTTLDSDEIELKASNGLLYRLSNDVIVPWSGLKVVVTYAAGYSLLAGLPFELERACLDLVKLRYYARDRDPLLRSEKILDVTESAWTATTAAATRGGLPDDIARRIDAYRRVEL